MGSYFLIGLSALLLICSVYCTPDDDFEIYVRGNKEGQYVVPGIDGVFESSPSTGKHSFVDGRGTSFVHQRNLNNPEVQKPAVNGGVNYPQTGQNYGPSVGGNKQQPQQQSRVVNPSQTGQNYGSPVNSYNQQPQQRNAAAYPAQTRYNLRSSDGRNNQQSPQLKGGVNYPQTGDNSGSPVNGYYQQSTQFNGGYNQQQQQRHTGANPAQTRYNLRSSGAGTDYPKSRQRRSNTKLVTDKIIVNGPHVMNKGDKITVFTLPNGSQTVINENGQVIVTNGATGKTLVV